MIVETQNLGVTFGGGVPVEALADVGLKIPEGALFALLGPNGAGKTSLMRCVTGLLKPTTGRIDVFGQPPARKLLHRMGVSIENPGSYGKLTSREYLRFFGSFYAIAELERRIRSLCDEFGLDAPDRPVSTLSRGNRQKLQLVRSLLHTPSLLLWDEPTDHLDPDSQNAVLAFLQRYLSDTGASVFLASHRLEQMEGVATHFGFLGKGRLVFTGTRHEVLGMAGERERFEIEFPVPAPPERLEWITGAFPVEVVHLDAGSLKYPGTSGVVVTGQGLRARIPEIVSSLCARGFPPCRIEGRGVKLSEIYERLLGKSGKVMGNGQDS